MQLPVSCFQRLTNWWTGEVDQSARTHTTASTGGRRMRLPCGTVVVGPTSDTQHVALEVPGRNCSACATTLLRLPSGHGLIATIFMTRKNGSHGFRTANVTFRPPRSQSIQRNCALPSQLRRLGGQCVWATPSSMYRGHRHPAALATGTTGLLDPRAPVTPLAISLGLRPLDTAEAARVPTRACVEEVLQQGALPPGHVYVGMGNHTHRLPTTKWKSPWQVGVNCTPQDWIPYYVQYIRETLWCELDELEGLVLVCDCPAAQTCEADLLAGLIFDRLSSHGHRAAPQVVQGQHGRTHGSHS